MKPSSLAIATQVLVIGSAMLGGCLDLAGESASPADYDDVARALGAIIADEQRGELNAFGGAVMLAQGELPSDFERDGDIIDGEQLGLAYSLAAVCSDALNRGMSCAADASLAHVEVAWAGQWQADGLDTLSTFDGDWILSDLAADSVIVTGQAHGDATVTLPRDASAPSDPRGSRTLEIAYRASYDAVAVDNASLRPVAGSVRYQLSVQRRAGQGLASSFEVTAELSFAADGSATLVLDGDHVYTVAE